jgi:hypothetical protein
MQQLQIVAVPISQYSTDEDEENAADIEIITEGLLISEEREGTISEKPSSEKREDSGWIVHRTHYGCPTGLKSGTYDPSTGNNSVVVTKLSGVQTLLPITSRQASKSRK